MTEMTLDSALALAKAARQYENGLKHGSGAHMTALLKAMPALEVLVESVRRLERDLRIAQGKLDEAHARRNP